MSDFDQALDINGLSEKLRRPSDRWVRRHLKHLPHVRIGHDVYFLPEHVEQIIAAHTVRPEPEAAPSSMFGEQRTRRAVGT